MNKIDFLEFYNGVVKKLGMHLENEYRQFHFCDNPDSLYEECLNQKTMLRVLYQKKNGESKTLLDRHKVCACMTAAIIKVRLVSGNIQTDDDFSTEKPGYQWKFNHNPDCNLYDRTGLPAAPFRTDCW